MTKEELEKEATEYAQKLGAKDFIAKPKEIVAYFGYLAGAEPREIQLTKARKLLKILIEDYISEPEVLPDGSCEDNELRNLIKEVEQFLKESEK